MELCCGAIQSDFRQIECRRRCPLKPETKAPDLHIPGICITFLTTPAFSPVTFCFLFIDPSFSSSSPATSSTVLFDDVEATGAIGDDVDAAGEGKVIFRISSLVRFLVGVEVESMAWEEAVFEAEAGNFDGVDDILRRC